MVELYWPRNTTFLGDDAQYSGPGVHNVPDDQEERFRDRGWEDPPDQQVDTTAVKADDEDDLEALKGVGEATADDLRDADYHTFDDLREASIEDLADVNGVSQSLAQDIHEQLDGEDF